MKVRALASLSGPMGEKAVGEVFDVKAEEGRSLIENNQAEEVTAATKATDKPKAETAASGE
ncbi:hypothetical protein IAE33_000248 [Pseudomonas sp. S60]|uniref:hypothetical protein n=1 Tax=Pseudomonas sp. S60 TaxID=211124 RepID=UPI0019141BD8|nr:hypothetical protein [Pseudomonas sp. S60]MBK5008388.1 hypothetical protein [Pseudomonas sp. S60]